MSSIVRVLTISLLGFMVAKVPLAAQTNLTATATAPTSVALTWTAAANATGYRVLRGLGTANLVTISSGKVTATTYTDASAPAASALRYRIVALYQTGPNTSSAKVSVTTPAAVATAVPVAVALVPVALEPVSLSPASAPPGMPTVAPVVTKAAAAGELQPLRQPLPARLSPLAATAGPAPQNLRVQSQGPLAHTVVWDPLPGVSGYLIAFSGKIGGEFQTVTPQPIAAQSYQHAAFLTPGGTYRVTALYPDGRQGSTDFIYPNPPVAVAPTGFTVQRTGLAQVRLTWKPVPYAKTYRIFGTGRPQDGGEITTTETTFSNLPEGSYSWQVTADYGGVYAAAGLPTANITLSKIIVGFADTHTHPFANLASGGRLFWGAVFGPIEAVLSICEPWHGFAGLSDAIGNIRRTMNGNISVGHKTGGYPNFDGWPAWNTLDHQQMHSDWIYRAYQGGLRLLVSHAVNNGLVCSIAPKAPGRTCDDMEAADLQIDAAKQMEAFTDGMNGGPGKGWFRIAYSPADARRIIADNKLAVVLGIEVDKLFGCGRDECDAATVDAQLSKYYQMGVRHLYPVHFADNAFGGYALGGDMDRALFAVNSMAANRGGVWSFALSQEEDCSASFAIKCNQRGLTLLGSHLITSMMNKGMIIDIDHMGKKTTDGVLALTAPRQYPVISGHTGFVGTANPGHSSERDKSDGWLAAIKTDGGMVSVGLTPGESRSYTPSWRGAVANDCPKTSKTWVQSYLYAVDKMGGPDNAAVGLASDQFLNELLGPRFDNHCAGQLGLVFYPIATRTGANLGPNKVGNKTFDYNIEGLAHYGMLPEFIQDLKNEGLTNRDLDPLFRSAEGYIELWERAIATIPVP